MSARARWTAAGLLAGAALALLALGPGAPRLTLLNASVRVDFAWAAAAAGLLAGLLLAGAAALVPPRGARLALALAAALAVAFGAARLRYRLEIGPEGLHARGLAGSTGVAWAEVTRVDRGTEALVVWGRGEAQVRVDIGSLAGDQKAALERALARRIMESTQAPP